MTELFRATPSLIVSWQAGYIDDCVRSYFKLEEVTSPAMQEGKEWHKIWENWVKQRKTWPLQFDPEQTMEPFIEPRTELKLRTPLLSWLELVGVIDVHAWNEGGLILDWKTGKKEAAQHIRSPQTGIYALLAVANQLPVKKLGIAHYDQKKRKTDTAYRWVSKSLIEEAFETVETVCSEIHSYFQTNGFYEQYGAHRAAHYAGRPQEVRP